MATETLGTVVARLDLDSSSFDSKMAKSGEAATASGKMRERAAKQAADAEAFAAKFAGDTISDQTLRIVAARKQESSAYADVRRAQQLAKAGYEGETGSANLLAAAMQRLSEAKMATAAASRVEAAASEASVLTQRSAVSAVVRATEGQQGIRAVEGFITMIGGGGLAQSIFPLVGGGMFLGLLAKIGEEIAEFIKKANEMPESIRRAFDSLNLAAMTSNDQLRLTNDELQNSINKLEGKPQNDLVIALDETRIKADELAKSLDEDVKKVKDLLAANNVTLLASFLGQAPTGSVAGSVNSFQQKFSDIGYARAQAAQSGDKDGIAARDRELAYVRQQALDWAQDQLNVRNNLAAVQRLSRGAPGGGLIYQGKTYQDMAGDQSANRNILQGFRTTIQDSQDSEQLKENNGALTAAKKAAEDRAEQARKGLEAQRKADEAAVKAMEDGHRSWLAITDRSKADEVAYWAQRMADLKTGSASYLAAVKQFQLETVALNRENATAIASFSKEYLADFNKTGGALTPEADKSNEKAQGGFAKDYIQSLRAQIDGNQANADAIAKASIQMELATGLMTKLDAAQAMAALHTQEYNDALAKLQDRQAMVAAMPEGLEKTAQLNALQTQRAALDTNRSLQIGQDQFAANGRDSSALVGATNALDDFTRATRDSAAEMRNLIDKTLNSLNSELVRAISTHGSQRQGFADLGAGIFRSVAGTALQKGEGSILGALGFGGGKPTGSAGSPFHVIVDNTSGASGPGAAGLQSALSVASAAAAGDKAGAVSAIPQTISTLLKFLPGFAEGGDVPPNTWAMVGERGPEPFFSGPTGGTVIPNNKKGSFGGGGDTHNWNVDARGSSDPAAVEAAVNRAIMTAAPHIAAMGVRATQDQRMRMPPSRRG